MAKTKLSDSELKALLQAEKLDSLQASTSSQLSSDRSSSLDYYMGDVSADIPTIAGRSGAVSTDVADTVEGLMPSLMEIFASSDDAVRFEPVGPEDVEAAEQETAYVSHVFWQLNDGYHVLYSMIKDALLNKTGIVKVWWDESESEERETYLDRAPEEIALLVQDPNVEIVEHTAKEDGTFDVTVARKKSYACAKVEAVPPEEFGIAKRARKTKDTHYCFHEVVKPMADLIDEGYDADVVKKLETYSMPKTSSTEQFSRDTVQESQVEGGDSGINKAMRPVRVTEHYVKMDYEGTGKPRLYRVVTGGEDGVVLTRNGEPAVVEQDFIPFAVITPFMMPHRVFGRSVADVVKDIQQIKTVLIRGLLDNTYAANMPRPVVAQTFAGETTLDDLAVMSHGAVIRTQQPGAIEWQQVPSIVNHVFPVLQYFDSTREWRTGVSRQGQGLDADALQNQTATAAQQLYNASQARMKLIARTFAETGIRDLFWLLHGIIRKNAKKADQIRFNSNWVAIDPRNWRSRNDLTVTVGLGQGGKTERLQQMQMLIAMQKEALVNGLNMLVTPKQLYNAAREVTKLLEHDVEQFFTDPGDEGFPEPPPSPEMIKAQVEQQKMQMQAQIEQQKMQATGQLEQQKMQMKAQVDQQMLAQKADIERIQAEADIVTQNKKTESEMALAQQKFQLEKELKLIDAQLKIREHEMDQQRRAEDFAMKQTEAKQAPKGKTK
jgi:hypothetical protein